MEARKPRYVLAEGADAAPRPSQPTNDACPSLKSPNEWLPLTATLDDPQRTPTTLRSPPRQCAPLATPAPQPLSGLLRTPLPHRVPRFAFAAETLFCLATRRPLGRCPRMFIPAIGLARRPRPALCARQPFALIIRLPLPYCRRRLGCALALRLLCPHAPCPLKRCPLCPLLRREDLIFRHTHTPTSPVFSYPLNKAVSGCACSCAMPIGHCKPALPYRTPQRLQGAQGVQQGGAQREEGIAG